MMLFRVIWTECLKLKRTLALWMMAVSPLVVVLLQFLIGYYGAETLARRGGDVWPQLVQNSIGLWTLLMMPLFLTLETSLLAGLEHAEKNWKALLTLPAPRWTVYASKLIVTVAMLWVAVAILFGGTVASGAMLKMLRPVLKLGAMPWEPLARALARIAGSALLALTIQHWVSLRSSSFAAAMGFGMCATVIGFVAVNSVEWGGWWPWSMPIYAIRGATAERADLMPVAVVAAAVVAVIGCWEFSRREVS
jgi:hypothetical protein